jgi:uncharacterized small protein (DUF1192 family)
MSAAGGDPVERAATLQAELDAVKRREASFRAKMVHEFLERGERNTYMHTLREERAALVKRGQEASSDLEVLTRKLEASSQRAEAAQSEIERIKASFWWRIARMFVPAPAPVRAPRAVTIRPFESIEAALSLSGAGLGRRQGAPSRRFGPTSTGAFSRGAWAGRSRR